MNIVEVKCLVVSTEQVVVISFLLNEKLLVYIQVEDSTPSAVFTIQFISYSNPNNRQYDGSKCSWVRDCHPTFAFCFDSFIGLVYINRTKSVSVHPG